MITDTYKRVREQFSDKGEKLNDIREKVIQISTQIARKREFQRDGKSIRDLIQQHASDTAR